jgi:biotin carboxyl carrier protein
MARRFRVTVDGETYEVLVTEITPASEEAPSPRADDPAPAPPSAHTAPPASRPVASSAGTVAAPLPGVTLEVRVAPGDSVRAGDVLVILEAMKMENEIAAPRAGVVEAVHVEPGANVGAGDALVTIRAV